MSPPTAAIQRHLSRLVGSPWFWLAFVGIIVAWPIVRSVRSELPPALPVLGTVPDFQSPAEPGPRFGSADLRGRTWVATFFFTRCTGVCGDLLPRVVKLQGRVKNLGQAFHLVTFSTDGEYDTTERLQRFTEKRRVSPRMWTFLAGVPEPVRRAFAAALQAARGPAADEKGLWEGRTLVLVDGAGRIRGYYDFADPHGVDTLLRDAGLVVNRGG